MDGSGCRAGCCGCLNMSSRGFANRFQRSRGRRPAATVAGGAAGRITAARRSGGSAARAPALPELWLGVHLAQPDPALLQRLAVLAQRFTPRVSLEPPDGLVLEVQGSLAPVRRRLTAVPRVSRRLSCRGLPAGTDAGADAAGGLGGWAQWRVIQSAGSAAPGERGQSTAADRAALAAAGAAAALKAGGIPRGPGPAFAPGGFCATLRP